jgi:putative ABC transport system ATP-binding protein
MSASPAAGAVISLDDVTKAFGEHGRETTALRGVTLAAHRGQLVLLLGPSGSGKTTLLTLAAGLSRPTSGTVRLFGRRVDEYGAAELQRLRAAKIGFIFQTFLLLDSLTAQENVAMVLHFNGDSERDRRSRSLDLLNRFGVGYLARQFPRTMSQGEKQRVAVARAMANRAELVLADEPTGSLESRQGFGVIRLLHEQARQRSSCVLVASHDLRLTEFADRTFRLEDGMLRPWAPGGA